MCASPLKIWVIDDHVIESERTRSLLIEQFPDATVVLLRTPEDTLAVLRAQKLQGNPLLPDLILFDVRLSDPEEFQLLLALNRNRTWRRIAVAVWSGSLPPKDADTCRWLGAFHAAEKPATPDDYAALLAETLARFHEHVAKDQEPDAGEPAPDARNELPVQILLIEDSPGDAAWIREVLKEAGGAYRLRWVQYLEHGLDLIRQVGDACHVVLLDLSLPDAPGGLQTLSKFRAAGVDVPVVVVTGFEDENTALESLQLGAEDYLFKRLVEPVTLVRSIRYTVGRRRLDRMMIRAGHEAEEAQVEAVMNKVAAGVAHHVNNLLTVVLGHGLLASESLDDADPAQEDIQQMIKAAERIGQLTRQIQASGSRCIANFSVADLNDFIRTIAPRLHRQCGDAVTLTLELAADLPPVRIDRALIEGAIFELIENAVAAMPVGGSIVLRTDLRTPDETMNNPTSFVQSSEESPVVVLELQDSGEGMSAADLEHAFQPFWTTRADQNRAGMGLPSVYGIIKQHRANLRLHSRLEEGTTVIVEFAAEPLHARPATSLHAPSGLTILVVDDETLFREFAVRMLSSLDHHVLSVANGGQALEMSSRHSGPIDLVLSDIMIPGLSALEMVRSLQEQRPALRHLFMTGGDLASVQRLGLQPEQHLILQKPFSRAALGRGLAEALLGAAVCNPVGA